MGTSGLQKVGTHVIFPLCRLFLSVKNVLNFTKRYVAANVSIKNSKISLKFFLRCRFFLPQVSSLLSTERLRIRIFTLELVIRIGSKLVPNTRIQVQNPSIISFYQTSFFRCTWIRILSISTRIRNPRKDRMKSRKFDSLAFLH